MGGWKEGVHHGRGWPGQAREPLPQSTGSSTPVTAEGKGRSRETHDWAHTLVSKRLFAELLLLDEVFTHQFF